MLNGKAKLNLQDNEGNTPLGLALIYDHSNVAINLIQNDASVNHKVYVKKKDETSKNDDNEEPDEPQVKILIDSFFRNKAEI